MRNCVGFLAPYSAASSWSLMTSCDLSRTAWSLRAARWVRGDKHIAHVARVSPAKPAQRTGVRWNSNWPQLLTLPHIGMHFRLAIVKSTHAGPASCRCTGQSHESCCRRRPSHTTSSTLVTWPRSSRARCRQVDQAGRAVDGNVHMQWSWPWLTGLYAFALLPLEEGRYWPLLNSSTRTSTAMTMMPN